MSANWIGLTIDTSDIRLEAGTSSWRITRRPTCGLTLGLVWGPLRRPYSLHGKNPWLDHADVVLRLPWIVLPWFHVWFWTSRDARDFIDKDGRPRAPHPARFYIGGKLFEAHDRPGEDVWRDPKRDPPGWYVTPSASFRDADLT